MEPAELAPVVQNLVTKADVPCTVSSAAVVGASSNADFYEAACQGGVNIVLNAAFPQTAESTVSATSCLQLALLETGVNCTLMTPEASTAFVAGLPAAANHPCTVTNSRYIAESATSNTLFFEFACSEGPATSFVAGIDYSGAVTRTIPCVQADAVGGCTLTDVTPLIAANNASFTAIAKAKGFNCEVESVSSFPTSAAVTSASEIKCSNRPESAVVLQTEGNPQEVMNCIRAQVIGFRCSLSSPAASIPLLTNDLVAAGRGTDCQVNGARPVGVSATRAYLEVTCSDGTQGYMITYPRYQAKPEEAIVCSQAENLGGGCTMPSNVRS